MPKPEYHINLTAAQGAKYAILPGDPARTEQIASYFDSAEEIAFNREFRTFRGTIDGENVLAVSTGIGGPSAAICMEELIHIGVDTFVRVGTCGGMQMNVLPGDLVIATGAIRMDGTVHRVDRSVAQKIPRGVSRLEIQPEVINYTIQDPNVGYMLEGFDQNWTIVPQNALSTISY
ncbi:MAG: hypothetical protein IJM02_05430, partial [Clostridia bacterium]|nr:hypothetical protein [Clostridia bacterium]